jgi:hypothetical protein
LIHTKIYSNGVAFAVIKADGTIATWGNGSVGAGAPSDNGYTTALRAAKA